MRVRIRLVVAVVAGILAASCGDGGARRELVPAEQPKPVDLKQAGTAEGGLPAISGGISSASVSQAKSMMGKPGVFLLDVRTRGEFAEGHIDGAVLIPLQELEGRISDIAAKKDLVVVVYCRSGRRSAAAAKILSAGGFGRIVNVEGGVIAWRSEGHPLVKGERP